METGTNNNSTLHRAKGAELIAYARTTEDGLNQEIDRLRVERQRLMRPLDERGSEARAIQQQWEAERQRFGLDLAAERSAAEAAATRSMQLEQQAALLRETLSTLERSLPSVSSRAPSRRKRAR